MLPVLKSISLCPLNNQFKRNVWDSVKIKFESQHHTPVHGRGRCDLESGLSIYDYDFVFHFPRRSTIDPVTVDLVPSPVWSPSVVSLIMKNGGHLFNKPGHARAQVGLIFSPETAATTSGVPA